MSRQFFVVPVVLTAGEYAKLAKRRAFNASGRVDSAMLRDVMKLPEVPYGWKQLSEPEREGHERVIPLELD